MNLELLEDYLNAQIAEQRYDCDANLTMLKLYQLNPDKFNAQTAAKILLKAMMALPRSDTQLAKCLIDAAHVSLLSVPAQYAHTTSIFVRVADAHLSVVTFLCVCVSVEWKAYLC